MIRETRMTYIQKTAEFIDILCEVRDNDGEWVNQGIIPTMGKVKEVMEQRIAFQENMGWTLYDREQDNVLTFWKEL